VCSNRPDVQLARVCQAIEELAGRPENSDDETPAVGVDAPDGSAAGDNVTVRLAAIWAMIAAADPELARRLPGYLNAGRYSR
jgi:hypothetical protein